MPKNYFKNHDAFWSAANKMIRTYKLAQAAQKKLGKNPNIDYDHRNLYALTFLTIDIDRVPEEQREQYLFDEYKKIHDAFDNSSESDPKRSDSDAVKPYIRALYDSLVTDLDTVNFDDPKQIEKVLATMFATQCLAIMVKDYPTESMELYPTREDRRRIDAICSKAFALQLEARSAISYEDLDEISYQFPMGKGRQRSTSQLLQSEIIHAVSDSTLKGSDVVMIDPGLNDLSTKFFLNKPFSVINDIGFGPEEFTEENYAQVYATHFADSLMNTSFEYQIFSPAMSNSLTLENRDSLLINGKPLQQLIDEYGSHGMSWPDNFRAAGKLLREALLNGDPVTLVSSSFSKDGDIKFHNKSIKLDLDKLNELEREKNHNIFRRALDTIGLWPIPKKYPTNEARDAKLSAVLADPDSEHQKQVKAVENEFIRSYNSIDRVKNCPSGCGRVIPKITREEEKGPDMSVEADKTKNLNRESIAVDLSKSEKHEIEPPKSIEEKTVSLEPKMK